MNTSASSGKITSRTAIATPVQPDGQETPCVEIHIRSLADAKSVAQNPKLIRALAQEHHLKGVEFVFAPGLANNAKINAVLWAPAPLKRFEAVLEPRTNNKLLCLPPYNPGTRLKIQEAVKSIESGLAQGNKKHHMETALVHLAEALATVDDGLQM